MTKQTKRFKEVIMEFGPIMSKRLIATVESLAARGYDFKLEYRTQDGVWSLKVLYKYDRVAYNIYEAQYRS